MDMEINYFIFDLVAKLNEYHNGSVLAEVVTENIEFLELNKLDEKEFEAYYKKVKKLEDVNRRLNLRFVYERAKIYKHIKDNNMEKYMDKFNVLQICWGTADRYIKFHDIILAYPGLLISNKSYLVILDYYHSGKLGKQLSLHPKALQLIKLPLREMRVNITGIIKPDDNMGTVDPPQIERNLKISHREEVQNEVISLLDDEAAGEDFDAGDSAGISDNPTQVHSAVV